MMKYEVLVVGAYEGEERPSVSFSVDADGLPELKDKIKEEIMREMNMVKALSFDGSVTAKRVVETVVYDSSPLAFSIEPKIVVIRDL